MGVSHPLLLSLILCLWYTIQPAHSGYEQTCYLDDRRPHRRGLCGSNVQSVLDRICAVTGRFRRNAVYLDGNESEQPIKYAASKRTALSYLGKRSSPQGFVCECCFNQCSLSELREYCH